MLALCLAFARPAPAPGHGRAWMLGPFVRLSTAEPALRAAPSLSFFDPMRGRTVAWAQGSVDNPAEATRGGRLYLLFRAEDAFGGGIGGHTSRIGLAESVDGRTFVPRRAPVLFPARDGFRSLDWPGGCEDPRVVACPGGYVMTYTSWNRERATLSVATSPDLVRWRKRGPAFSGAARGLWTKSGAIVVRRVGSKLVAAKIGDRYWMYWGDTDVWLATSPDLVRWTPLPDSKGMPKPVLEPRKGRFDEFLCEAGPPAVLTKRGIVLIYNGARAAERGGARVAGEYAPGQALFDAAQPYRLLDRSAEPFLRPETAFERKGQYQAGTVFAEGLAWFNGGWELAYGAADSCVGLARARG